ncbi:hypothetical protein [Mucilaginibacter sp. 10B2]|uniref:hypothetical protein n=1 Tax=Mucilaginibacter sp. 10B2 TaxID=3048574 RepID=UPI002B23DF6A|nr:hypothetical protein [Mucilaginibacter sp. 10B2]MEB0278962.1 hypothetical protein [Mucilaginibacter sp. 10B2]
MQPNITLNTQIVKHIDYATEEYVKSLLSSDGKLEAINPYIGLVSYPSDDFLQPDLTYKKAVQFQGTTYVGHLEFLLPPLDALSNVGLSYTLLSFILDGKNRQVVQVSSGASVDGSGKTFKDFILKKFPSSNPEGFAFNRHAFHTIRNIEISGGIYENTAGLFVLQNSGKGSFTPSVEFEIAISGFKCLLL